MPDPSQLKTVFTEYAKKDSEIVRAKGTKPVFFMSWAYADKPEMTAQLAEAYTIAGNANNALVIPAGLAFARAISKQPELNLYARGQAASESLAGTYLATCVVFAALTGRRRSAIPISPASTRRRRNSCRTSPGRPCRNITGSRRLQELASAELLTRHCEAKTKQSMPPHAAQWIASLRSQ